jgi:hypothetical protein
VSNDKTVSVSAGAYATVRATEKARRTYGDTARAVGIIGPTWGRAYLYRVEMADERSDARELT